MRYAATTRTITVVKASVQMVSISIIELPRRGKVDSHSTDFFGARLQELTRFDKRSGSSERLLERRDRGRVRRNPNSCSQRVTCVTLDRPGRFQRAVEQIQRDRNDYERDDRERRAPDPIDRIHDAPLRRPAT